MIIFFGDPKSKGVEEDARACVRMAMEMQKKAKETDVPIQVGICSGEVMIGNFGSEEHVYYTIIGRSVNAAAQLATSFEAGRILIAGTTYELVKDEIPCELRGGIPVKGIDRPLTTYWVS